MDITEAFELVDDISEYDLKKNGFRNGTYKCFVYKDIIQLIIDVEINKDEVYGKLKTTGKFIYKGKKYLCWECECKCGNIVYASASDLKTGHTTSCGKCEDKAYYIQWNRQD